MLGASTSDATSTNLAAIRDVLAKGVQILVINVRDLVTTERTWLLLKLL